MSRIQYLCGGWENACALEPFALDAAAPGDLAGVGQSGVAVAYWLIILGAAVLTVAALIVRARGRDRRQRDELRAHVQRIADPSDSTP